MTKFLIYGKTGWIGGLLGVILTNKNISYEYGTARLENRTDVINDILKIKPTHILCASGITGSPNVDWCESHKIETIRTNVIGMLNLIDIAKLYDIHLTSFATGCIYEYDKLHPMNSQKGYVETDEPNFIGSYYSKTKKMVEELAKEYNNLLVLRLRMPISSDLQNPRNFVYKIAHYDKVVNIPNSMSVLDELLPIAIDMSLKNIVGIFNFTNPGVITHNEVLSLYKQYVEPQFEWKNFTLEEQAKILAAPRSNNELDTTKLQALYPNLKPIKESLEHFCFRPYTN